MYKKVRAHFVFFNNVLHLERYDSDAIAMTCTAVDAHCYNGGLFHAVDTPVTDVVLRWFGHATPMRR